MDTCETGLKSMAFTTSTTDVPRDVGADFRALLRVREPEQPAGFQGPYCVGPLAVDVGPVVNEQLDEISRPSAPVFGSVSGGAAPTFCMYPSGAFKTKQLVAVFYCQLLDRRCV